MQRRPLLWPLLPAETDAWMIVHYVASVMLTVAIGLGSIERFEVNVAESGLDRRGRPQGHAGAGAHRADLPSQPHGRPRRLQHVHSRVRELENRCLQTAIQSEPQPVWDLLRGDQPRR